MLGREIDAYYVSGSICTMLALYNFIGFCNYNGPLDRRMVMGHRGVLFTFLGSVCALEPKFGVVSLIKQAAIRFWLSPTNMTVLAIGGVTDVYYYHSYNSRDRLGTIITLMLASAMSATQLALFILTNENS